MTYLKHITCAFCGRRRVDDGTNTCPGCIRDKENKDDERKQARTVIDNKLGLQRGRQ